MNTSSAVYFECDGSVMLLQSNRPLRFSEVSASECIKYQWNGSEICYGTGGLWEASFLNSYASKR